MDNVVAVVLAAGQGTRMKSDTPKVLHPVCGKSMIRHVVDSAKAVGIRRVIVVVGHEADKIRSELGDSVEYAFQRQQMGTGHAVLQAEQLLDSFDGTVVILYGDVPALSSATLSQFIQVHTSSQNTATVLTAILDDPTGYGRILYDSHGCVSRIVEDRDATVEEKAIREINSGTYCFQKTFLFEALKKTPRGNAQNEYYLTDAIEVIWRDKMKTGAFRVGDPAEIMGVNTRLQLAEVGSFMRSRILRDLMLQGVTIIDPSSTFIDPDCNIERDVTIYPCTIVEGRSTICSHSVIGPFARLTNVVIGKHSVVESSTLLDCVVGDGAMVGPYSYIRPGTVVKDNVKVGTFVEVKKSIIGNDSKVPHLSYIGDTTIGESTNIGAGSITCNYDGKQKHATLIGNNVFVGSNTNFVAPVTIGDGSVIGAGSTITKDVPEDALAVARSQQKTKEGWARRRRDACEKD